MDFDTRPACYAVIVRDDHVLLTHYSVSTGEGWTLPGGGMEQGESPEQCCLREVHEETGYQVRLLDLASARHHWVEPERRAHPEGDKWLLGLQIVYRAEITGGDMVCEVEGSTDDVRWVPLAELDDYDAPHGWPGDVIRESLDHQGSSVG